VTRLGTLLLLGAIAAPAQFLEFRVRFDDGGCLSCAESLEERLERVRGVETATLDLERGIVEFKLAADNRVRLAPLMSRIEQGAAKALETRLVAKGVVVDDAGVRRLELQGAAAGQVYFLEGDTGDQLGPAVIEADLLDAVEGRLRVVSIRPAE
jgi:copper chaperone CopZ